MSDDCKIIDISHHQDFPNFEQVAAAGVIAMIHKATEGSSYVDPNRATNCSNANRAGIATATYHWLSPGSDPADQMAFYLATIQPQKGERVVIDYEQDGCTLDGLKKAVQALLDHGNDLQITVYSGHLLKEQLGDDDDEFLRDNTDLWLAQYTTGSPSWSDATYDQWTLWQYSETGEIDGIDDTYVDLNRFNGSDEELIEWISPAEQRPMPSPQPPPLTPPDKVVDVAITAPEGVTVNVTVNGVARRIRRRRIPRGPDIGRE